MLKRVDRDRLGIQIEVRLVYWHTSLYSDVILDRSPETYENVNRLLLATMPVTFYSVTREGEMASVVGNERTKNAPVKSVKEIRSSDHCKCLKSVFLSIHQCKKWGIIYEIEYYLMFYDTRLNR